MKTLYTIIFCVAAFICSGQATFYKVLEIGAVGDIKNTPDGNIIITGNDSGACLIKSDLSGNIFWSIIYADTFATHAEKIIPTADSGFVFSGAVNNPSTTSFIAKVNALGITQWAYATNALNGIGSTSDGGFIVTPDQGIGIAKLAVNGMAEWTNVYHASAFSSMVVRDVKETADLGFIITGVIYTGGGSQQVFLLKTDSAGTAQWGKAIGTPSMNEDVNAVFPVNGGGYVMAGVTVDVPFTFKIRIIKTDAAGMVQWAKNIGNNYFDINLATETRKSVQLTQDGGLIMSAAEDDTINNAPTRLLLIKTDSGGNMQWNHTWFNGDYSRKRHAVMQTPDGRFVVAAHFEDSLSNDHVAFIMTDSLGNTGCYDSVRTLQVNAVTLADSILTVTNTTSFSQTALPFPMANHTINVNTVCITGINETASDALPITVYPNPSHGNFYIEWDKNFNPIQIEIYNVFGQKLYSHKVIDKLKTECTLKNSAPGIYFIKLYENEKSYFKKIIIE